MRGEQSQSVRALNVDLWQEVGVPAP
jgi:hypothetical protein